MPDDPAADPRRYVLERQRATCGDCGSPEQEMLFPVGGPRSGLPAFVLCWTCRNVAAIDTTVSGGSGPVRRLADDRPPPDDGAGA